jgi:colicin import membrane protein
MISDRWLFSGLPALLTIGIHVGIILVLGFRWAGPTQVIAAAPTTQAVQAVLVSADSLVPTPTPKPQPKPKLQPKPKPKPKPTPQLDPTPAPPREVPPPAVIEPMPEVNDTPESDATQLAAMAREELANMTTSELSGSESISLQDAVAATIQRAVINRWTRPPSARNGMVSVLSIQLVPTGEVVGVGVLTTSGDAAFDRSAISAVERVGKFPEIAQLDSRIFETTFRRFQLIFRPEDLRY